MHRHARGFTLVEVLVATTIIAVTLLAAAQLLTSSAAASAGASGLARASVLAVEKMEQLRALPMAHAALAPSPPDTLAIDVDGFFDAPDARFIRRWSIEPLPSHPDTAIAITVVVMRVNAPGEARLVTIKTKRAE